MTSVGVFREKEINGKPYLVFTFSSGEASIDSGGSLHQTVGFLCPFLRFQAESLKQKEDGYSSDDEILPLTISPHFLNTEGVHQRHVQELLESDDQGEPFCKDPMLPVDWCNSEKLDDMDCFICKIQNVSNGFYLCGTCDITFHKECVESPPEIKAHPYCPSLPLQLCNGLRPVDDYCFICETKSESLCYRWPNRKLAAHPVCSMKSIPIVIDHIKRHPHPLTLFPKQAYLPCDVCGLVKESMPTYICAQCVFVVHRDCIYFPYVIRISRHRHRISFTSSLPFGDLSCGVCRRKVDNHYGAYSCNKCDGYFVHSRCALRKDLWDGKELEGVPEEVEVVEDPFETIADGIILHFSHRHHHLKLKVSDIYDEGKLCQACILPIYEGNYYSCMDDHCVFILHETCASAPHMIRHPLHAHSLTLDVTVGTQFLDIFEFYCDACTRASIGFFYGKSGEYSDYKLDLRCAAISEPFKYEGHEHPLCL